MRHTAEQIPSHSGVNKGRKKTHTPEPSNHISVQSEILYLSIVTWNPADTDSFQTVSLLHWNCSKSM